VNQIQSGQNNSLCKRFSQIAELDLNVFLYFARMVKAFLGVLHPTLDIFYKFFVLSYL